MPPTAGPDGPGIVPAGEQPRLPLDQDPKSQVPPTIHPHGPTETQCLFSVAFQRASFWFIMAPGDLPEFVLFSSSLALKDPLFSLRLPELSCENSQISYKGSYPWSRAAVQRPGHNSVRLCSLPHNNPEQAHSLSIPLFSLLPLFT